MSASPSPVRDTIAQALDALREKEAKLVRVREALGETRREIKVLERILYQLNGRGGGWEAAEAAKRREAVLAVLRDADGPLTAVQIAAQVGMEPRGITPTMRALERRQQAVRVERGWEAA